MVLCENIFNFVVLNVNKLLLIIKTKITIMKKLFIFLLVALFATQSIYAQDVASEARKEAKKGTKSVRRDGFKLLESGDLEGSMARHLEKVLSGKALQLAGTAEDKNSINIAVSVARNNAINAHVELASSVVKGRIVSEIIDLGNEQTEKFLAQYERILSGVLKSELSLSYTLYKEQNNKCSVRAYYLLDYERAQKIHLDAIRHAAEQQGLWQMYGSRMSIWINGSFIQGIAK